jgi:O-antigen ligase
LILRRGPFLTATQFSTVLWIELLGYLILWGGTPGGEFNGWIRAVNGVIAAVLIIRWVAAVPTDHDQTDRGMLAALLLFLAASVASDFPRQSLDASIQATALVAGFYFARRQLTGQVRASIESAGAWLCVGLSVFFALAWGLSWTDWLIVSGGGAPPRNLPLETGPFGHQHDVALLVVILAPAMWSAAFSRRRFAAITGTALAAGIVLVEGSRNVWLAALGSSLLIMLGYRVRVDARGVRIAAGLAAAGAIAAAGIVLASPGLSSRIANVESLLIRFSVWNEAAGVWLQHPLTGLGPGAFPFSYMLSDHFRFSLFDPRHPDSAIIQLLVEGGFIGLAAAFVCVGALIRGARKRYRGEPRAVWALLFFALATMGSNPTDFVFLLVPMLVWAAILDPASGAVRVTEMPRRSPAPRVGMRIVLASATAVVVAGISVTGVASISYEVGRDAYLRGDSTSAEAALGVSIALDPSLSIYRRERASLAFARGDWTRAVAGYRHSLEVSPYDPVAWRGLALALLANADIRGAARAADDAVRLMYLDPANQLVRATTAQRDPEAFRMAVRVALQQAPSIAIASWDDTVLGFADRIDTVRQAVDAEPPVEGHDAFIGQVWLALFADRPDVAAAAAAAVSPLQRQTAEALAAVAACDIGRPTLPVESVAKVNGWQGVSLDALSIVLAASGRDHQRTAELALRLLRLWNDPGPEVVTALAGDNGDFWRFRRRSLGVVADGAALPSSGAATWTLLTDPAYVFAQLETRWPPGCGLQP